MQNYGTKQAKLSNKSIKKGRKLADGKTLWVYLSGLNSQSDWEETGSSCDRSQVNVNVVMPGLDLDLDEYLRLKFNTHPLYTIIYIITHISASVYSETRLW